MYPVGAGGIAEAVTKMAMGNRLGAEINMIPTSCTAQGWHRNVSNTVSDLFTPLYGAIIVETELQLEAESGFVNGTVMKIGFVQNVAELTLTLDGYSHLPQVKVTLAEAEKAWESKLAGVFPTVSGKNIQQPLPDFALAVHPSLIEKRKNPVFCITAATPRVLIPVFPGTNCEYDMARAFTLAGAKTKTLVFRNNTQEALADSLAQLRKELQQTQIFALAGGFSAGDEPDGSGKFIANVLREARIAEEIIALLEKRDGLVLGICNGFQALIKTGLIPFGKIMEPAEDMPTLTFNTIGRHISRIVRTRMVSAISPWAQHPSVIDRRIHIIPVSHGEGRIVVSNSLAEDLFKRGQVFSQYVDEKGIPAVAEPDNPNGSLFAIEGLTSPDGRVLGKMGHSERAIGTGMNGSSGDLLKNVAMDPVTNQNENSCENIFAAGVSYFK